MPRIRAGAPLLYEQPLTQPEPIARAAGALLTAQHKHKRRTQHATHLWPGRGLSLGQ